MATMTGVRRELASRASNGVEVSLFWSQLGDRITVEVIDEQLDEGFEFEVGRADALDAFNHPYAYAASRGITGPAPATLAA